MLAERTLLLLCAVLLCWGASASAQNTAEELFEMGFNYQTGEGLERDEKRALSYYADALRLKPELFAPLYNSALIYHDRGEYTRAQNLFIKAARAAAALGGDAPRYESMARNGLGTCYQMQGKYESAEKQFDIARRIQSDFVEAHFNYINILVRDERLTEAANALKLADQIAPSDRYQRFRGQLSAKKQKESMEGFGGLGGVICIVLLILGYGIYLRRLKGRN